MVVKAEVGEREVDGTVNTVTVEAVIRGEGGEEGEVGESNTATVQETSNTTTHRKKLYITIRKKFV